MTKQGIKMVSYWACKLSKDWVDIFKSQHGATPPLLCSPVCTYVSRKKKKKKSEPSPSPLLCSPVCFGGSINCPPLPSFPSAPGRNPQPIMGWVSQQLKCWMGLMGWASTVRLSRIWRLTATCLTRHLLNGPPLLVLQILMFLYQIIK